MSTTFRIERIPGEVSVVRGEGRLNMVAAPELRSVIREEIDDGHTRVVVDLGGITFMDSTGLGALVGCLKSARQAGGDLRIASPNDQVALVLQLSNLDRVLKAHPSPEAAFRD